MKKLLFGLPVQDTDFVLCQFGCTPKESRAAYRGFVIGGLRSITATDFEGGGLRRSAGGWQFVPDLRRGRERWAYDERILGSSEFVYEVIEILERDRPPISVPDPALTIELLCKEAADRFGVAPAEIASPSLRRDVLRARAVVCHLAVRRHGVSSAATARQLGISARAVARALNRARSLLAEHDWNDANLLAS